MVRDYGSEQQQQQAGGKAVWFTVLPTLDVLNRCVPTKHVTSDAAPDRCAYPACDPVTNPWMQCDAEFPSLWTMTTLFERSKCEVKFQSVRVDQLATTEPSPLVERIADKVGFLARVISSLVDAQTEILLLGLLARLARARGCPAAPCARWCGWRCCCRAAARCSPLPLPHPRLEAALDEPPATAPALASSPTPRRTSPTHALGQRPPAGGAGRTDDDGGAVAHPTPSCTKWLRG